MTTLHRLPVEVYEEFLTRIRLGANDVNAAASLGIVTSTFYAWMKKGREASSGMWKEFYDDVMVARGEALFLAEAQVYNKDPRFWLRCGPGKHLWTEAPNQHEMHFTGEVEHTGEVKHTHQPTPKTLGAAFAELQRLGYLQPGEQGKLLFQGYDEDGSDGNGEPLTVESSPVESSPEKSSPVENLSS